jgi:hypothetical protein
MSEETFEFASYDLANGTKIECDTPELEVGSIISVVKEDGTKELAPAGEHVLSDKRTIVLDDSAKVTEIKETDAPTETEADMKKSDEEMKKKSTSEEMAMETDPELVQAVFEMLKSKVSGMEDAEMQDLSNNIVYAITAYDEAKDMVDGEEDSVENGIVTNTTTSGYSAEFAALSEIVLEMAKKQEEMSTKLSKVPTGKAISEMEFGTEDSTDNNMLEARIAAIKNLNK